MKVFVSQPMRGRTDAQILEERERGLAFVQERFPNETIELIDTFFQDFNGNRLEFLGKSISEGLAKCDLALFIGNFEMHSGCRVEHAAAHEYGVRCLYMDRDTKKGINFLAQEILTVCEDWLLYSANEIELQEAIQVAERYLKEEGLLKSSLLKNGGNNNEETK